VQGFVRIGDLEALVPVVGDPVRDVRIALADGLGSLPDGAAALGVLVADEDLLVRAAAFKAVRNGEPGDALVDQALAALSDPSWQVREGAAQALERAGADVVVAPLIAAAADPNLDVRKSAVRSLTRWAAVPEVARALRRAARDPDADVRAFARAAADAAFSSIEV
jgi:HEAT repeat protein